MPRKARLCGQLGSFTVRKRRVTIQTTLGILDFCSYDLTCTTKTAQHLEEAITGIVAVITDRSAQHTLVSRQSTAYDVLRLSPRRAEPRAQPGTQQPTSDSEFFTTAPCPGFGYHHPCSILNQAANLVCSVLPSAKPACYFSSLGILL